MTVLGTLSTFRKHNRTFVFLALVLVGSLFVAQKAGTQSLPNTSKLQELRPRFIPGQVIVRYRSEATAQEQSKGAKRMRIEGREVRMSVEKIAEDDTLPGLRLVHVDTTDTLKAVESLKTRADVLYAEPNFLRYRFAIPNDQFFPNLWALLNTGIGGLIPGVDIDAEPAWDITKGSRNVVVGVVDGGIDVNHADLQDNIWRNPVDLPGNGVDEDGNGLVDDVNGFDFFHNRSDVFDPLVDENEIHGTHVAGTIGATGNNGIGVVGVNWEVSLMSLKVLGRDDEFPEAASVGVLVRAYAYAKKMRDLWTSSGGTKGANIRVLNNSIGGYEFSQAEADAVRDLNDAGILFVAAAGNFRRNNDTYPIYPAGYDFPNVISVAATGFTDVITNFSNVGARTVHISAPGFQIMSTTPFGNYSQLSGTSMASPLVSGAAALICAAHPDINVRRLRASLIYNGDFASSQFHATLSSRRLNVFNSLKAVAENDFTAPGPIADFRVVSQNGRSLILGWRAPGDDANTGTSALYDIRFSDTPLTSAAQFDAATPISPLGIPLPSAAGSFESATVEVPFGKIRGFIGIRSTDNMGNNSPVAVVPVISAAVDAQFYDITESAPQPLSTGGVIVAGMRGSVVDGLTDDAIVLDYQLPFAFPYYGHWLRNINISMNGALYFSPPPKYLLPPMTSDLAAIDFMGTTRALQTQIMIAGMWEDLMGTVYAVTPDPDRIIFRWEGKTFDTLFPDGTSRGKLPVNFEIELRRNGTIQVRYGDGNEKLFPIVGLSGGSPSAYVVASHTSEAAFKNLGNANTVTFTPRFPPAPSTADLQVSILGQSIDPDSGGGGTALRSAIVSGQVLQYSVKVENLGPDSADNVVLTAQLPNGTSFVGCVGGPAPCNGPPPGTNGGTVTVAMGTLGQVFFNRLSGVSLQVRVNAPAGTTLATTFSVSNSTPEGNPANNVITATTLVADLAVFGGVAAVDGSRTFTVAAKKDGTVWLWGIPPGTPESSVNALTTPKLIEGLSDIVSVSVGFSHVLALKSDGTVWSWGVNDKGQLGVGPMGNVFQASPPRQVLGLSNIQSVVAAGSMSLALKSDGTVWGWGENEVGLLTGGSAGPPVPAPVQLNTISGVRHIASSGACNYAVKQDGTLWSWSDTREGQCGTNPPPFTFSPLVWLQVPGVSDVRTVKSRFNHTIALLNDGSVWTWGSGSSGQLGDGTQNSSPKPIRVNSLTGAQGIAAADSSCLVLKSDGTVWLFGDGQLTPVQVAGLAGVKAVAASVPYAVIMSDDTLQMWGFNGYGQLGDGTVVGRLEIGPVKWLAVTATPIFNPDSQTLVFQQDVVITCETNGAVIHYTTNGVEPTEADPAISTGGSVRVAQSGVLKAKAFKSGLSPSKTATSVYQVLASDPGSIVQMLLEESAGSTNEAAAVDSMLATRGPFSLVNTANVLNQGTDRNTRVILFTRNLQLFQGEAPGVVRIDLYDADGIKRQVNAEDVRAVSNTDLTQVTFRLPDNLAPGNYTVTVNAHSLVSNLGVIVIKP